MKHCYNLFYSIMVKQQFFLCHEFLTKKLIDSTLIIN